MTPQELKSSILQLAIQGKLVEQRPKEGTAEELYRQIQAERKWLIQEGKIKKGKQLPGIEEGEIPFEIPDSWKWIRLGDLIRVIGGISYKKYDLSGSGLRILRGGNIQDMKVVLDENDLFLPNSYDNQEKRVQKGDFLVVASTGSKTIIGKAGHVDREMPDTMIGAFLRICRPFSLLVENYLRYIFESSFYREHIRKLTQGTNINNVRESYITEFIMPLPPLGEQRRIVAKIEKLIPYIDRYKLAWSKLEDLNNSFPTDMEKSILQLAFQGKLVEQYPEEGTAEELCQQIQAEKKLLIKEGKIKKGRQLPDIEEDEIPFEIPDHWEWVRLRTIVFNRGQEAPSSLFSYIDIGSIDNKNQRLNAEENLVEAEEAPSRARKIVKSGDILYSTVRPYLHNMCIVDRQFSCKPIASTGFAVMTCHFGIFNKYLFYYLMSPAFDRYANHTENAKGIAYPAINDARLYRALVPLPPFAEQERIVEKIEEMLPLCKMLKK